MKNKKLFNEAKVPKKSKKSKRRQAETSAVRARGSRIYRAHRSQN